MATETTLRRWLRNPSLLSGAVILGLLLVVALVAPLLLSGSAETLTDDARLGPGAEHLLGTDAFGRDVTRPGARRDPAHPAHGRRPPPPRSSSASRSARWSTWHPGGCARPVCGSSTRRWPSPRSCSPSSSRRCSDRHGVRDRRHRRRRCPRVRAVDGEPRRYRRGQGLRAHRAPVGVPGLRILGPRLSCRTSAGRCWCSSVRASPCPCSTSAACRSSASVCRTRSTTEHFENEALPSIFAQPSLVLAPSIMLIVTGVGAMLLGDGVASLVDPRTRGTAPAPAGTADAAGPADPAQAPPALQASDGAGAAAGTEPDGLLTVAGLAVGPATGRSGRRRVVHHRAPDRRPRRGVGLGQVHHRHGGRGPAPRGRAGERVTPGPRDLDLLGYTAASDASRPRSASSTRTRSARSTRRCGWDPADRGGQEHLRDAPASGRARTWSARWPTSTSPSRTAAAPAPARAERRHAPARLDRLRDDDEPAAARRATNRRRLSTSPSRRRSSTVAGTSTATRNGDAVHLARHRCGRRALRHRPGAPRSGRVVEIDDGADLPAARRIRTPARCSRRRPPRSRPEEPSARSGGRPTRMRRSRAGRRRTTFSTKPRTAPRPRKRRPLMSPTAPPPDPQAAAPAARRGSHRRARTRRRGPRGLKGVSSTSPGAAPSRSSRSSGRARRHSRGHSSASTGRRAGFSWTAFRSGHREQAGAATVSDDSADAPVLLVRPAARRSRQSLAEALDPVRARVRPARTRIAELLVQVSLDPDAWTAIRTSSPAANGSGWRSHGPSPRVPGSSSPTRSPRPST